MDADQKILFDVVIKLVQVLGVPLIGIAWLSINNRFKRVDADFKELKGDLKLMVDKMVTPTTCKMRHDALGAQVELTMRPVVDKLSKVCNGGSIDTIKEKISGLEKSDAAIEARMCRIETAHDTCAPQCAVGHGVATGPHKRKGG